MKWEYTLTIDKKFIVVLFLAALTLGGGLSLVYLDLKTSLDRLQREYASLSAQLNEYAGALAQLETIQRLIKQLEELHYNETLSLPAVQIYNMTRKSVVLVVAGNKSGSGFVYSWINCRGYIVTNHHVVEGSENNVKVTFFINGKPIQVPATVKGKDIYSDLAVLEVENIPEEAKPLLVGDSTKLLVGEPVYAIGNPFGLEGSMTAGIVSQLGRVIRLSELGVSEPWGNYSIVDLIQFDAAVNPGNSGGPLLNSLGEVVGVTFAIETAEGIKAFIGIGYAIPSIIVKRVADSIIAKGKYEHPWVGILCNSSYIGGVLIEQVEKDGPAFGKLQPKDVIVEVDNRTINRVDDMLIYLERYKSPGDTIRLKVVRDGEPIYVDIVLGVRPE
ncbi:MAG: trypsin-like peptidase domain-containing protein [Candidatus Bathyarchaeia archaeon]